MRADLGGQVVFITGGAGGIGRATAHRLAANGASIVVADIDADGRRARRRRNCRARSRFRWMSAAPPMSSVRSRRRSTRFGRIDVLVNNAGVNTFRTASTSTPSPRRNGIASSASISTGSIVVSRRRAAADGRKRGQGRIINIASVVGVTAMRLQSAVRRGQGRRDPPDPLDGAGARAEGHPGQFAGARARC